MPSAPTEYRCFLCRTEIDETEFSDPRDANVCGWCFTDRVNDVLRRRGDNFAAVLDANARWREAALQASIEIDMEESRELGKHEAVEAYERILRTLTA